MDRALDSAANDLPSPANEQCQACYLSGTGICDMRSHTAGYRAGSPAGLVIEAGCGEGYGAAILSDAGFQVIAVDDEEAVVDHVRRRYPQVEVMRAGPDRLPIATQRADAVVSLQVIEHPGPARLPFAESARVPEAGA